MQAFCNEQQQQQRKNDYDKVMDKSKKCSQLHSSYGIDFFDFNIFQLWLRFYNLIKMHACSWSLIKLYIYNNLWTYNFIIL